MSNQNNIRTYKKGKKYQLAIRLSALLSILFILLAIIHIKGEFKNTMLFAIVASVSLFCLVYVYKTKNYKLSFYVLSTVGSIIPSLSVIFLNDFTHYTEWIWMCCAIFLAFLGTNKYYGFFLVGISIITATIFVHYSVNMNITETFKRTEPQLIAMNIEFISGITCVGYLMYLFHDFYLRTQNDLIERNKDLVEKNLKISQQDEEKTVLVKEIHHRVKNNLQIITSLLRMQKNEIENEDTQKHFNEAINRIMAMSLIHQKLYQENSLAKIELENYLDQLLQELVNIYNLNNQITSTIKVDIPEIGLKSIVPLGLLLNELISNSLEHGFSDQKEGKICIFVQEKEQFIILNYSDNGTWKSDPILNKPSFGLELIDLLTEQLEGNKQLETNESGSHYSFKFKNLDS